VVSASPARGLLPPESDAGSEGRPGSLLRWERTAQGIAAEHGMYVVLAQLVGFEGGKGFPGGSLVVGPPASSSRGLRCSKRTFFRVTVDLEKFPGCGPILRCSRICECGCRICSGH
jgi:predicted amidohydrolase